MSKVIVKKEKGYAIISMLNEKKRNALDATLSKALIDAAEEIAHDNEIRSVILTGENHIFCAGADLNEFSEAIDKTALEHYENMKIDVRVFDITKIMGKPVIAAVEGYAFGGGFGLVCGTHIVISSPSCKFGMPELSLGIFPYVIFPYVKKAIGLRNAIALALTRKIIDAKEAKEMGLIYEISDNPLDRAKEIAESIASTSPIVFKLAMDAINTVYNDDIDKSKELALLRIVNFSAKDLRIGIEAFKNKTKPLWKGE